MNASKPPSCEIILVLFGRNRRVKIGVVLEKRVNCAMMTVLHGLLPTIQSRFGKICAAHCTRYVCLWPMNAVHSFAVFSLVSEVRIHRVELKFKWNWRVP